MIQNGDTVKDKVSGFKGMVTGVTYYLNGCVRMLVSPTKLRKEGGMMASEWIDQDQLELVSKKSRKKTRPTGGPREAPLARPEPLPFDEDIKSS